MMKGVGCELKSCFIQAVGSQHTVWRTVSVGVKAIAWRTWTVVGL